MMSYMMFNAMKLKLYCYYPCPSMLAAHAYWRSEKSRFIGTEAQSIFFMQTTDTWLCFWRRERGRVEVSDVQIVVLSWWGYNVDRILRHINIG